MLKMLSYAFMQRAFLVGFLVALIIPCIGIVVVLKRLSMLGDAISHSALAGVAGGLMAGANPVIGAAIASVIAAFGIEGIRKKIPRYAELSIAIIMSAGIGLAGVLSGFVQSSQGFSSFLFGSIVAISDGELWSIVGIAVVLLLVFFCLYRELFFVALDERSARLAGVPVALVNFLFTMLTALTIAIASRTVGALIVSSLMVVPTSCAMQISRSFRQTLILSIVFAIVFTMVGITLSYFYQLKPGGTIVLLGILCFLVILFGKKLRAMWKQRKELHA